MGESIAFYSLATVLLASALTVIGTRSPITSLLSLLVAMCSVAGLFVLLGAYFLAALQLLIYAGAVLILFLFVLMLLNVDQAALARAAQFSGRWLAVGLALVFCLQIGWVFASSTLVEFGSSAATAPPGTIVAVGRALFRDYLLPFELISLLILVAIIGAVALAQRKIHQ